MSTILLPSLALLVWLFARVEAAAVAPVAGPPVGVAGASGPHVRATLAPHLLRTPDGRRFLDVQFTIEADWHMYWRNPGDSGQPPRLEWSLPAGWSAGEPIHPVPNHLPEDEDILAFERSLRLLVPVTAPQAWAGGPVAAELRAQWMTCKEHCVVERQVVRAELDEREGAMPVGYPEAAPDTLTARLQGSGDDRVLVIDATAFGGSARWFPDACPGVRFPSERMQPMPGGRIEIPLGIRVGDAPNRRPVVRGMVVIGAGAELRAFDVAVPVDASAAK